MTTNALVPPGLVFAEKVLGLLKAAAKSTALWTQSTVRTNEMHGPSVAFKDAMLHSDMPDKAQRWKLFLAKHWDNADGVAQDATNFFVARKAAPAFLEIRTFERLDYIAFVQAAANVLDGTSVALVEDRSWTWDNHVRTSVGRPLYRRAYLLRIELESGALFNANAWLDNAMQDVCASADERASRCPFQLAEEAGIEGMSSAEYTKAGLVLEAMDKATLERVAKDVFAGCKTSLVVGKKYAQSVLTVAFP